jgi:hypothetical protein
VLLPFTLPETKHRFMPRQDSSVLQARATACGYAVAG